VNVTIAGAGVVGCAIAHELAARGARVRVLDSRVPGGGATRASAGILAPYIEGHDRTLLALCLRSLAMYDGFRARVAADSGEDVEYERRGTLQIASTLDEANQLKRAAKSLGDARVDRRLLDAVKSGASNRGLPRRDSRSAHSMSWPCRGGRADTRACHAAMRYGATFDVGAPRRSKAGLSHACGHPAR
jgi:glycine/D-amino acid oxidase-like deaminating enzyme